MSRKPEIGSGGSGWELTVERYHQLQVISYGTDRITTIHQRKGTLRWDKCFFLFLVVSFPTVSIQRHPSHLDQLDRCQLSAMVERQRERERERERVAGCLIDSTQEGFAIMMYLLFIFYKYDSITHYLWMVCDKNHGRFESLSRQPKYPKHSTNETWFIGRTYWLR